MHLEIKAQGCESIANLEMEDPPILVEFKEEKTTSSWADFEDERNPDEENFIDWLAISAAGNGQTEQNVPEQMDNLESDITSLATQPKEDSFLIHSPLLTKRKSRLLAEERIRQKDSSSTEKVSDEDHSKG